MHRRHALLALAALAGCRRAPPAAAELRVAAASDLALALPELSAAFERQHGARVVPILGSTGLLARQIAEGAPFDVFAAANVSFVDGLVKSGQARGDSQALYARGRLVVWTRPGAPARPASLADLADPRYVRIAIANPEHAPYGKAAREALERAGVLEQVRARLVYGENIQQTMQFAQTGNADAALLALSLVRSAGGDALPIDEALHAPIDQAIVVTQQARDPALARAFVDLVVSPEGRAVLARHGFAPPPAVP